MQTFPGHRYFFAHLDSTQRYLLEHPASLLPLLCVAREQSAGVGQRGRVWQSPPGHLYMSLAVNLPGSPALHQGLAQAIALCLAETLDPKAQRIRLKWPNDLFLDERKLGGILVDTLPRGENLCAVIGIGINLSPRDDAAGYHSLDENACADTLLDKILPVLMQHLETWQEKPYLPINHRWAEYDRFHGKTAILDGIATPQQLLGIDQKGRLIAKDTHGKLQFLTHTRIHP
ncbi:MAG: biotin--[acetyl-CoA-carboxylase] ligase [Cardiobacteriaceae bacterium]|nr:biotin--[acetyl-CoA-carboxylase] ligase [Cardiobacteriaceae bacterium]